jgi:uracil-DNA glycosylase
MVASLPDKNWSEIARLRAEIMACSVCTDLPLGPRPVLQIGTGARILIVGQAPGRRTHHAGRPFDDASGARLRDWLGLDEATFRDPAKIAILPMGFCYPGTGRSGDLPPRPECAPLWRARAMAMLPDIALTVVIGRHAQSWHLPETSHLPLAEAMRVWRARWPTSILLPHPSPRNTSWFRRNDWFETDLLPVLRVRVAALIGNRTT